METSNDRKAFQLGYWIAVHKPELRRAHIALWCAVNAVVWIFFFTYALNWLTHIQQTADIWKNISASNVVWSARTSPQDIVVQQIATTRYNPQSVDVLVELYNPNGIWSADKVSYTLIVNGIPVEESSLSIAPLQQRYITRLRLPNSSDTLPNVRLTLGKVTWNKMADATERLPAQSWSFENTAFHEISGDAAQIFRTEFAFDIFNKSVYGFRQVKAVLGMYDAGNRLIALNSVVIDKILTTESRQVVLRWPEELARTSTPRLFIDLDLLDDTLIIRTLK